MTTSDVAASQHDRQRQRCIRVVGSRGVGKRSLMTAMGANAARVNVNGEEDAVTYDWRPAPALATVKVVVYEELEQFASSITCEREGDVYLLCFDLTDSESFRSISDDWCSLLRRTPCRVVLVGTKCDDSAKRRVTAAQAMELALVECDECVEVGSTQPPFEGVVYLRQLLATWLTQDPLTPGGSSPLQSLSREKPPRGLRSSVWLYDPTEEIDAEGQNADVKLRPISRALFEMREAGGDRTKSLDRRREQSVAKLVMRSRYYGPTESSRSQRWQAHQQQQQKQTTRSSEQRRQSTTDIDVHDIERTKLEGKSFMQTTKLTQQRLEEMKLRTIAPPEVAVRPKSSKDEKRKDRSRTRAMSTLPASVLANRGGRARTASLSPSHHSSHSPSIRPLFSLLDDDAAGEFALNLLSPGAEKVGSLPAPPLLAHIASPVPPVSSPGVQSFGYSSSDESSDDDVLAIKPLPKSPPQSPPATVENDKSIQETEQQEKDVKGEDDDVFSTEIDDMLDYFDGITLPI